MRHAASPPALLVRNLRKAYKDVKAVDGLDLEVGSGECFGLLGPNGAGKTTTIEICEGLTEPDSGDVEVLGLRWASGGRALRQRLGIHLQETQLSEKLTVLETLRLFRSFFHQGPDASEVIRLVQLEEKQHARVGALSGGQKQRLALACALVGGPDLLFLDEPTTGLDPQARRSMWDTILKIRQSGATVFMTTHYMEEAQTLCERVAVVDMGKIIALDTPNTLINRHFHETVVEFDLVGEMPPEETFSGLKGATKAEVGEGQHIMVYTNDTTTTIGALTDLAEAGTINFDSLEVRRASLEDVFLKITGKHIRE
jgi:ABC-2 type transport system ATP-binding protein